jgi:hypothetical protein
MVATQTPAKITLAEGKEQVMKAIEIENYRYERYEVPFCLVALSTENPKHFEYIKRYLRMTDIFIPLSDNCACIALASTEIDEAVKMGSNFIRDHATLDQQNRIYFGVTSVKHDHLNYDIVSRAFYSLEKAREQNISTVEDDNILESMKV